MSRKTAVVIGGQQRRAVIMLREICQYGQRFASGRLHCEHRQLRVHWATWPDHIGALVARVHVGPDGELPKRIAHLTVRTPNPATVEGMVPIVDGSPPDA